MRAVALTLFSVFFLFTAAQAAETPSAARLVDRASYLNLAVHDMAQQLLTYRVIPRYEYRIGVSTFVDLRRLDVTTPFGQLLAELLLGELQRAGFRVLEVRLTKSLLLKKGCGEFSLSRVAKNLSTDVPLNAVLVGTYLVRDHYVFINARLVSKESGEVLSTAFKILPLDPLLASLLHPVRTSPRPPVMVKIEDGLP